MDKVLKKDSSKCITPSSEPFRIDLWQPIFRTADVSFRINLSHLLVTLPLLPLELVNEGFEIIPYSAQRPNNGCNPQQS
jgi:hypothetical protein